MDPDGDAGLCGRLSGAERCPEHSSPKEGIGEGEPSLLVSWVMAAWVMEEGEVAPSEEISGEAAEQV